MLGISRTTLCRVLNFDPKMYDQFAQSVESFKALLKTYLFIMSLHKLVKVVLGVKS